LVTSLLSPDRGPADSFWGILTRQASKLKAASANLSVPSVAFGIREFNLTDYYLNHITSYRLFSIQAKPECEFEGNVKFPECLYVKEISRLHRNEI